jgi:replicative DNA helicase
MLVHEVRHVRTVRAGVRLLQRSTRKLAVTEIGQEYYLQLLRGTGSKPSESRVNEVSKITRGLNAIAK